MIPGYSMCCRKDREGGYGGGIAVYCLNGIAVYHEPRRDPDNLELVWLAVGLRSKKLLISALYRPPSDNNDILDYIDNMAYAKMDEFGAHNLMIIGDFNVHHRDWLGSNITDNAGRRTLQLADGLGLNQIVTEPTRGENILDLVLTHLPAGATTLANIGSSDHNPVLVKLKVPVFRDKPYKRKVWCYEKASFWDMRGYLSDVDWPSVFKENNSDNLCTKITDIVIDAMEIFIPNKTVTKKTGDKAWFDDKCRCAANKKRRLYRQMRINNNPESKNKFIESRKMYNKVERQAKINYNLKIKRDLADNQLSSKKWWGIINSISGRTGKSETPIIVQNGISYESSHEKAEVFCQTFSEKCKLPNADDQPPDVTQFPTTRLDNIIFKPKYIKKILQKLDTDKASGPDMIPAIVLKMCCAELASPLCRLFQLCYAQGVFPKQWKIAQVIPIHKRHSKADPANYRPISLLSVISKVMETTIHDQVQRYLHRNNMISCRQFWIPTKPQHC